MITITITGVGDNATARIIICKTINCKLEMNNTETDNAKDIDIVIPMYNLIEYSKNY